MENVLVTAEHFSLYYVLIQLVEAKRLTRAEMEEVLRKSGLKKLKNGEYRDEEGSILTMNAKPTT